MVETTSQKDLDRLEKYPHKNFVYCGGFGCLIHSKDFDILKQVQCIPASWPRDWNTWHPRRSWERCVCSAWRREGSQGCSVMFTATWLKHTERKREFSQRWTAAGWEATETSETWEILIRYMEKNIPWMWSDNDKGYPETLGNHHPWWCLRIDWLKICTAWSELCAGAWTRWPKEVAYSLNYSVMLELVFLWLKLARMNPTWKILNRNKIELLNNAMKELKSKFPG